MGRIYAGVLGLLAFAVMLGRALILGDASGANLPLACGCLFVFAAIGWLLGTIAQQTVDQSVQFAFDQQLAAAKEAEESGEEG